MEGGSGDQLGVRVAQVVELDLRTGAPQLGPGGREHGPVVLEAVPTGIGRPVDAVLVEEHLEFAHRRSEQFERVAVGHRQNRQIVGQRVGDDLRQATWSGVRYQQLGRFVGRRPEEQQLAIAVLMRFIKREPRIDRPKEPPSPE